MVPIWVARFGYCLYDCTRSSAVATTARCSPNVSACPALGERRQTAFFRNAVRNPIVCVFERAFWVLGPIHVTSWPRPHVRGRRRGAAHVDRHPANRPAGEPVRLFARVVCRDWLAAVTADTQAFSGYRELAGLGPDAALAHLGLAVVERHRAGSHPRRSLAVLVERYRQDKFFSRR